MNPITPLYLHKLPQLNEVFRVFEQWKAFEPIGRLPALG